MENICNEKCVLWVVTTHTTMEEAEVKWNRVNLELMTKLKRHQERMDEESGQSLREAVAAGPEEAERGRMKRQQMNELREWKEIHKKTKGEEGCAEHRSSAGGSSFNG